MPTNAPSSAAIRIPLSNEYFTLVALNSEPSSYWTPCLKLKVQFNPLVDEAQLVAKAGIMSVPTPPLGVPGFKSTRPEPRDWIISHPKKSYARAGSSADSTES